MPKRGGGAGEEGKEWVGRVGDVWGPALTINHGIILCDKFCAIMRIGKIRPSPRIPGDWLNHSTERVNILLFVSNRFVETLDYYAILFG